MKPLIFKVLKTTIIRLVSFPNLIVKQKTSEVLTHFELTDKTLQKHQFNNFIKVTGLPGKQDEFQIRQVHYKELQEEKRGESWYVKSKQEGFNFFTTVKRIKNAKL